MKLEFVNASQGTGPWAMWSQRPLGPKAIEPRHIHIHINKRRHKIAAYLDFAQTLPTEYWKLPAHPPFVYMNFEFDNALLRPGPWALGSLRP